MNNNKIYELDNLDISVLHLGNPSMLNNNNYFSKLSHSNLNKNIYLQLPKCLTKQGVVKSSTKSICELNFCANNKEVLAFFENLERFCIKEIYKNRELWFYNSESFSEDDIEDLVTPIIKSYKQGKRFLLKTSVNIDKLNIYDENEIKIPLDEYNLEHEFIPLVNINGLKFSKNFTIELILTQMMVIYPSDEFEKQLLIKVKGEKQSKIVKENLEEIEEIKEIKEIEEKSLIFSTEESNKDTQLVSYKSDKGIEGIEGIEGVEEDKDELEELDLSIEDLGGGVSTSTSTSKSKIEIKTRDAIYLEIYKKAKKKAKEIRKSAIDAFLEAKNIKAKYNLDNLVNDSSSDEEYLNLE